MLLGAVIAITAVVIYSSIQPPARPVATAATASPSGSRSPSASPGPSPSFGPVSIDLTLYVQGWTGDASTGDCDGTGQNSDIHHYTEISLTAGGATKTAALPAGAQGADNGYCDFSTAFYLVPYSAAGYRLTVPGHGSILLAPTFPYLVTVNSSGLLASGVQVGP
jgi:hypothetical protein